MSNAFSRLYSSCAPRLFKLFRRISELNQVQVGVISGHNPDIGPTGIRVVRIEAVVSEWDMASDSWSLRVGHSERRKVREAGLTELMLRQRYARCAPFSLPFPYMGLFSLVSLS